MGRRLDIEKLMDLVRSNQGDTTVKVTDEQEKDLFLCICSNLRIPVVNRPFRHISIQVELEVSECDIVYSSRHFPDILYFR